MNSRGRWSTSVRGRKGKKRAVSDVVGTILLLALTVTLFASIFFFVDTFPTPPPATANQFQAGLSYGPFSGSGTPITRVTIVHLAGPTLSGNNVLIYLYSAKHPTRFTAPYTIGNGRNGSSLWTLGQAWSLNVSNKSLTVPDNITVSIATQTQLLFRVTLPGQNPQLPPTFVNSGTSPATLAIGQGFQIFVQIVDPLLKSNSVFVNVSQIPGLTGSPPKLMTYSPVTSLWTYAVPSGVTTAAGTYYVFVNASDSAGQVNSIAIPVVITTAQVTQASIQLSVQPSLPVTGSAANLIAVVTNPGAAGANAVVTFFAGGLRIGSSSGPVGGGQSASFALPWTPNATGPMTVNAVANLTGGLSVTGTLNLTVYPKILFIAHNVVAGVRSNSNESAYLAQSLVAAGVPFTSMFVSCTAGLPTSAAMGAYGVVIIDFGSNPTAGCAGVSTTEQAKVTGTAATTSFWLVGEWQYNSLTCASMTAQYLAMGGIGRAASGNCMTAQTAASAPVTWSATPASGLRADGLPAGLAINKTLAKNSTFQPYVTFTQAVSHPFFTTAAGTVGGWLTTGTQRVVELGTDPALLAQTMPNSAVWIDNGAGTSVTYNIVNYLCGFATTNTPGRGLTDHGVGGLFVYGTFHSKVTTVYAELRENGPVSEAITVTLYVNGSAALYNGVIVTATLVVGPNGGIATAVLQWQAPGAASFTISVQVTPTDLNPQNDQLPASILNQPVKIA